MTKELSQKIDTYRKERTSVLVPQTMALLRRKTVAMQRSLMSTLFEILVPAILILVGFSFTKVHFPIISPPR